MVDCLSLTLAWMPEIESYWGGRWELKFAAEYAVALYGPLSVFSALKLIFTVTYHHYGDTFIVNKKCICLYIAAIIGFFVFYLTCIIIQCKEDDFSENVTMLLYILLCVIRGICDVIWGTSTFIKSFVDPGLLIFSNRSDNTYEWTRSTGRPGSIHHDCTTMTEMDKEKAKQWKKDHEYDTIHALDAVISFVYTLINIYEFYPLIAMRSYLRMEGGDDV